MSVRTLFPRPYTPFAPTGEALSEEVTVPLSEHEQKLLEQMERALYAEDPKFASQMKGRHAGGPPRKRLLIGLGVALVGLMCIVAAVSMSLIWLGAVGFVVMVAGVAWAFAPKSGQAGQAGAAPSRPKRAGRAQKRTGSSSFMQRMEDRWDERKRGETP